MTGPGVVKRWIPCVSTPSHIPSPKNEFFTVELRNPAGGATLGTITKAVVTIIEDDSAIEFGTSNYVVNEADGYITITLVRKGSTAGTATVDLNISSGSAVAGKDFVKPASPTVTFADANHMQGYFGVTPEQASHTEYPVYTPHGGLRSASFGAMRFTSSNARLGAPAAAMPQNSMNIPVRKAASPTRSDNARISA